MWGMKTLADHARDIKAEQEKAGFGVDTSQSPCKCKDKLNGSPDLRSPGRRSRSSASRSSDYYQVE